MIEWVIIYCIAVIAYPVFLNDTKHHIYNSCSRSSLLHSNKNELLNKKRDTIAIELLLGSRLTSSEVSCWVYVIQEKGGLRVWTLRLSSPISLVSGDLQQDIKHLVVHCSYTVVVDARWYCRFQRLDLLLYNHAFAYIFIVFSKGDLYRLTAY